MLVPAVASSLLLFALSPQNARGGLESPGCVPAPEGGSVAVPAPGAGTLPGTPGAPGRPGTRGGIEAPTCGGLRPSGQVRPGTGGPSQVYARGALSAVTGLSAIDLGPNPDGWDEWWHHNREGFLVGSPWRILSVTGAGAGTLTGTAERTPGGLSRSVVDARILPALREALADSPSPDKLRALLLALARIGEPGGDTLGDSELQRTFAGYLAHPNVSVAETACLALGVLARPSSVRTLASLMDDDPAGRELVGGGEVPRRVRAYAAYGIGLLGERTDNADVQRFATHALVGLLAHEGATTHDEGVAAVVALGMLADAHRPREAEGCPCRSHDGVARRLLAELEHRHADDRVRAHVPNALARLAPRVSPTLRAELLRSLERRLDDGREDELVAQGCVQALGHLVDCDEDEDDARIRARLLRLASDGRLATRSWALMALAEIGSRSGAGDSRSAAKRIQEQLLRRLSRAKSQDEPWLALALGVLGRGLSATDPAAAESFSQALRDRLRRTKSPERSTAISIALGLCRDDDALELLVERLERVDAPTRALVATAIGLAGERDGIEPLRSGLHEARHMPGALEDTARSLALLQDPGVVRELLSLAEECDCPLSRQGLAVSLGRTRHPDAVDPLLGQLGSQNELEAIAAVTGLGLLAEKEERPWIARVSSGLHYRATSETLGGSRVGLLALF